MFFMRTSLMNEKLATQTPLDRLLGGGVERGVITNVFGPAGVGKTNVALAAVLAAPDKVVYIDTEGSFSLDRFTQMGGSESKLKTILLLDVHDWNEQHACVISLEKLCEQDKIGLIVVDSVVALYRVEMDQGQFQRLNKQLATQYAVLSRIARKYKIPIIVTNQVYEKGEGVELTSRMIARYWSKALIELKKADRPGHRTALVRKHRSLSEDRKIDFKIVEKGLEDVV